MTDMRPLWKKIRHRLEVVGMRGFVFIIPRLRRSQLLALANLIGDLVFSLDRAGRRVALANLDVAFGDHYLQSEREVIARKSFVNLARTFLDLFWTKNLHQENFRQLIHITGWEAFLAGEEAGRGTLFYAAHFGNFEWLTPLMSLLGYPSVAVVQEIKNPAITPFFSEARSLFGSQLIPKERAALRLFKLLKQGKTCGFLVDLTMKLDEPGKIITAFGLEKYVTSIHVALSQRTQARLIPMLVLPRDDGRYEYRFLPETKIDAGLSEQQVTQLCWNEIEAVIRQHPECWLWNYKHWRYQPEGASGYPYYAQTSKKYEKLRKLRSSF